MSDFILNGVLVLCCLPGLIAVGSIFFDKAEDDDR